MNFASVYDRQKRPMYHPMHNPVAHYWTEALQKSEMKQQYGDVNFLNNLHLIPDPLKKNLADTLITNEKPKKPEKRPETPVTMPEETTGTSKLGGIGSFFSGVLNVLSNVVFRSKSPVNYYECFEDAHQGSPQSWHSAKINQDKNINEKSYDNPNVSSDMNTDRAVSSCENKINQVLNLLAPRQTSTSSPVWVRKRPKKVFVEPSSVSESFEDAFSPEDFISLPEDPYFSCYSPMQYQNTELYESRAQKTMLNASIKENMEIVTDVTKNDLELKKDDKEQHSEHENSLVKGKLNLENDEIQLELENSLSKGKLNFENELDTFNDEQEKEMDIKLQENKPLDSDIIKCQLVTSCEDKLSKLKALLLEKRNKNKEIDVPVTEPTKIDKKGDKHYKNPNRRTNKRTKTKMKCKIEDDLLFANEINVGTPPSIENSPREHNINFGDYFDELKGRFRSASIGSEDSFQIVFNDTPNRIRTTSDCDSEDSFIVFEDSPESCYLSNDVFGSDSELSDSGCAMPTFKLSQNLTRTVSNLADDSLYMESEDEVDFAETVIENTGLLLDEKKKQLRKNIPAKKVHFSPAPPKVHVMRVWAFAAKQARAGHWERYAIDRERFKRRIADVDVAISWVLRPQHRMRVMFQRFMPWWNQQKRKELAEKEEKIKQARIDEERMTDQNKERKQDHEQNEEEIKDQDEELKEDDKQNEEGMKDPNEELKEDNRHNDDERRMKVQNEERKKDNEQNKERMTVEVNEDKQLNDQNKKDRMSEEQKELIKDKVQTQKERMNENDEKRMNDENESENTKTDNCREINVKKLDYSVNIKGTEATENHLQIEHVNKQKQSTFKENNNEEVNIPSKILLEDRKNEEQDLGNVDNVS